jgi:hypothetical protein
MSSESSPRMSVVAPFLVIANEGMATALGLWELIKAVAAMLRALTIARIEAFPPATILAPATVPGNQEEAEADGHHLLEFLEDNCSNWTPTALPSPPRNATIGRSPFFGVSSDFSKS